MQLQPPHFSREESCELDWREKTRERERQNGCKVRREKRYVSGEFPEKKELVMVWRNKIGFEKERVLLIIVAFGLVGWAKIMDVKNEL